MSLEYGFTERLKMSQGVSQNKSIMDILRDNLPGAMLVYQATEADDRQGTDWWVEMTNGDKLSVDCKVREQDYATRGKDDLALEIWSVKEKHIAGWTRCADKRTDYVLWLWKETGRWCLISFPMLCKVFGDKWLEWSQEFKTAEQFTPRGGSGYHSECVFVPRREVWAEIYRKFGGAPATG